jgi:tetratricopeptide (TPR) repeat protein
MLGIVAGVLDFDWHETARRFRLAMVREQISTHLRQWNSYFFLVSVGRVAEGKRQMDRVVDEDPLGQMWRFTMSLTLLALGLEDEGVIQCRKSVELDPQFWLGWYLLGIYHALQGRYGEAFQCADRASAIAPWASMPIGVKAAALAHMDRAAEAELLLDTLRGDSINGPFGLAYYSLVRGDVDGAVAWAGQAADQRFASLVTIFVRPFESRLRTAPGWPALLKKMNLEPAR